MRAMSSDESRFDTEPDTASLADEDACLDTPCEVCGAVIGDELVAMGVLCARKRTKQSTATKDRKA
jgi:hypothetical protein